MRQSQLFTKTRKEAPADETSRNAQLLIRAGFINKEMAGVYSLLPLGFKVVTKIKEIVNDEMKKLGSEEIIMSTIQNKETWEKTDRWSDKKVDIWFKSELKNGAEIGFGWSHEEPITEMVKAHIASYKDLPVIVHQFQNKLRNETRAKSGIMRCREFIMKDMYCFAATEESNKKFYAEATHAYMSVFERMGLKDSTFITSASGGVFTDDPSHEFQTLCESGEDIIYVNKEKQIALNKEIYNKKTLEEMGMNEDDFEEKKAAEVGNIFNFGKNKCEQMELYFTDKEGIKKPVFLSSYGIGITRLMGVISEVFADEKGLIWPESIAPFSMHLIALSKDKESDTHKKAEEMYKELNSKGVEVLFDDRDESAGAKFADSDLIGIPMRVVISDKSLASGGVEIKERKSGNSEIITVEELYKTYVPNCE